MNTTTEKVIIINTTLVLDIPEEATNLEIELLVGEEILKYTALQVES